MVQIQAIAVEVGEATFFWKSDAALESPDVQMCQVEIPLASAENSARFGLPEVGWTARVWLSDAASASTSTQTS
jgi:hypothetical protein